jgi:hypothetical protein
MSNKTIAKDIILVSKNVGFTQESKKTYRQTNPFFMNNWIGILITKPFSMGFAIL